MPCLGAQLNAGCIARLILLRDMVAPDLANPEPLGPQVLPQWLRIS